MITMKLSPYCQKFNLPLLSVLPYQLPELSTGSAAEVEDLVDTEGNFSPSPTKTKLLPKLSYDLLVTPFWVDP